MDVFVQQSFNITTLVSNHGLKSLRSASACGMQRFKQFLDEKICFLFVFSFNNVVHADKIGLEQKKTKKSKNYKKKNLDRDLNPRTHSPTATVVYLHFVICMYFEK